MKLACLWDPANPLVPVADVVKALRERTELFEIDFDQASHRTQPNRGFELAHMLERSGCACLLWIEGGPLPRDLEAMGLRKACWLPNAHLEPTLVPDLAPAFDVVLTPWREASAFPKARWMPLCAAALPLQPAVGLELLCSDPMSPSHARAALHLSNLIGSLGQPQRAVSICLGQRGVPHPEVFSRMAAGSVTLVDPQTDLRDFAHPGDHLLRLPAQAEWGSYLQGLFEDASTCERIAQRGREIVAHLHSPGLRAERIRDALCPPVQVLGGKEFRPKVSILVHCYRYLRRLRVFLDSLRRQDLPAGSLEIVVADPDSPDGLAAYLKEFADANRRLRVVRLRVNPLYWRNRGVCINRAFDVSGGDLIVSMDGDLVMPPGFLGAIAAQASRHPDKVLGVPRIFLDRETTDRILDGRIDYHARFEELANSPGDGEANATVGVLGYCQAVSRNAFALARYPEEFDQINQSDIVFNERLSQYAGVEPLFLPELPVLHLWHPRDWSGTKEDL